MATTWSGTQVTPSNAEENFPIKLQFEGASMWVTLSDAEAQTLATQLQDMVFYRSLVRSGKEWKDMTKDEREQERLDTLDILESR